MVALTMFRDHTFRYKYTPSSLPINLLQASRLYFQVSLLLNRSSSDELGIVLRNCYAESKSALSAQNTDVVDSDFGRRIYFVKNRLFLVYNIKGFPNQIASFLSQKQEKLGITRLVSSLLGLRML